MFVSHRENYIHSLFVSICDIYCSIHIIELILLMMCLNTYFQQQQHTHTHTISHPTCISMDTLSPTHCDPVPLYNTV